MPGWQMPLVLHFLCFGQTFNLMILWSLAAIIWSCNSSAIRWLVWNSWSHRLQGSGFGWSSCNEPPSTPARCCCKLATASSFEFKVHVFIDRNNCLVSWFRTTEWFGDCFANSAPIGNQISGVTLFRMTTIVDTHHFSRDFWAPIVELRGEWIRVQTWSWPIFNSIHPKF